MKMGILSEVMGRIISVGKNSLWVLSHTRWLSGLIYGSKMAELGKMRSLDLMTLKWMRVFSKKGSSD